MSAGGVIFNIQRYSIHDGPGIRTTVFLKGCPLRCHWCANPESQDPGPQLLVRNVKCSRCGACVFACPAKAISMDANLGRVIDWNRCHQCLDCVPVCLFGALTTSGQPTQVMDIVNEAERDLVFYQTSGGGVTISGGEPLFQPAFTIELLQALKDRGLHTALDTSGYAPSEVFREAAAATDLILLDLKHLDPEMHKQYTGVDNRLILANAQAATSAAALWIRIPLIQGFNDSREHIQSLAELAKDLGAEKLSLLPYHQGGQVKSEQIGKVYQLAGGKPPDQSRIQILMDIAARTSLSVDIGR